MDRLSEQKGHKVVCRDKCCSIQCLTAYMEQESRILQYFWDHKIQPGMKTIRGNLTLPPNASPDDHRATRAAFLKALGKWSRRNNVVVKLRCYSDFTGPSECHYDFVGYVSESVGVERLQATLSDLWRRAGGRRSSCQPLAGDEQAFSKYVTKARKIDRKRYRYVPVRGGLEWSWGTSGFWGAGNSREGLWREWIKAMFPVMKRAEVVQTAPPCPITIRRKVTPAETPVDPPAETPVGSFEQEWGSLCGAGKAIVYRAEGHVDRVLTGLAQRYPGRLTVQDVRPTRPDPDPVEQLRKAMPTSPDANIPMRELMARLGWSLVKVTETMDKLPVRYVKRYDEHRSGYYLSG